MPATPEFYRRHLPHWQPKGAVFFVTFRLKFSLPGAAIALLRGQQRFTKGSVRKGETFAKWDRFLDQAEPGPRWLAQDDIRSVVSRAMLDGDGHEHTLYAYCIMPNHVHAVLEPVLKHASQAGELARIMRSLKGHTAREANVLLCRKGAFWQDETYDHEVRDSHEFIRIIDYVLNNPVKAGLVSRWEDWPGSYCREGIL